MKQLFTNVHLDFKPYTVTIDLREIPYDSAVIQYRMLMRRAGKEICGTWAFSNLCAELGSASSFRGYAAFQDEADALQFMLMSVLPTRHVVIWPSYLRFTLHKVVDDN
jgi:hypothetical protein